VETLPPGTGNVMESERIRKCTINFFLEDDTIMVKEKNSSNSGLPGNEILLEISFNLAVISSFYCQFYFLIVQILIIITGGVLIKRQAIPKNSEENYTASDFNVGIDIVLFAKQFHIVGCDFFTEVRS
jgi:hypothetical protein